jgi:hypothetical protein
MSSDRYHNYNYNDDDYEYEDSQYEYEYDDDDKINCCGLEYSRKVIICSHTVVMYFSRDEK